MTTLRSQTTPGSAPPGSPPPASSGASATAARSREPLVSIGMPVYNGARYLRRALDSLLAQDYPNLELVISENGSTDETPAICDEYAARDPRVRVHRQPVHVTAIANFQTALDLARGDYFMWASDDDLWYPAFVSRTLDELERHPEAGVAMSAIDVVYEDGTPRAQFRFTGDDDVNQLGCYATSARIPHSKLYHFIYGLFRTDLLRAAMFVDQVPLWDWIMMSQIALATRFRYVDSMLHVRQRHGQPQEVRHADEPFNRKRQQPWLELEILAALARVLVTSRVVPAHRKLLTPAVVGHYGLRLAIARIQPVLKRHVRPDLWQQLAPVRRWFAPR